MNTGASLAKKEHFIYENTTLKPEAILKTAGNGSVKTSSCQLVAKRKVRFLEDSPCANEFDISPHKKRMLLKNPGIKLSQSFLITGFS